jgi:hemerythrin-like domain-containing protein
MDEILGARIKEIISQYPEVGGVLNDYGVTCVTCAVGTCLLKDILSIHRLSPSDEQKMMTRIAEIVYPGRNMHIPTRKGEAVVESRKLSYSPSLKVLVREHQLIKRLLAVLPAMLRDLDLDKVSGQEMVSSAVSFIQDYADKYHHAKEEDILFKYFDEDLDILKVMRDEHETGRGHIRAVLDALKRRDTADAVAHLKAYSELLTKHIRKEDEVLYPWLDRQLSDSQVGKLFAACGEVDAVFVAVRKRCEDVVVAFERQFGEVESDRELQGKAAH